MKKKKSKRKYTNTKAMNLPERFDPKFLDDADGRSAAIKELRRRFRRLKEDAGIDSYQKDILAKRAIFVACKLETMEVAAATTGEFNAGVYVQAVNCLVGLLKCLGLERKAKKVTNLRSYVEAKA